MTETAPLRPLKEAARITKILDIFYGEDRFNRGPVDVAKLAMEYSAQIAPDSPIHDVVERAMPGCVGALVFSEARPRQWAIMHDVNQSAGRRAFTIGHELGHYVLHRQMIEDEVTESIAMKIASSAAMDPGSRKKRTNSPPHF